MKQLAPLLALMALLSPAVAAQTAPVSEAMKQDCMAAVAQLVDTYDVASEAKTQAVSAVQQRCAFSKEVVERAVLLAAGTAVAGEGCTIIQDSKNATFIPGESCEARTARLAMAEARADPGASSATTGSSIEQRIYRALAQGNLLLPPGESAWDLMRSREAALLSSEQKRALNQEFDSQAKTCFNEALNVRPERIGRAKTCLEAIISVNPRWEHLDRERRRLAVAIDPIGVTTDGVDAVLNGTVAMRAAQVGTAVSSAAPAVSIASSPPIGNPAREQQYGANMPERAAAVPQSHSSEAAVAPSPPVPAMPLASTFQEVPAPQTQPLAQASTQVPSPVTNRDLGSATSQSDAMTSSAQTDTNAMPVRTAASSNAAPTRKLALVVGNSQYSDPQWGVLPNTVNDVRLVSAALRSIGFDVSENADLSREGMITAYSEFEAKANGADIALVYYAGHAVQVAGENILMPVDAKVGALTAMRDRGLNADSFRESMSGANLRMLVLDSCRDNPYSSRSGNQFVVTRGASTGGGLASMRANDGRGRKGSVVLFSTAAGEQALDGTGENSPFAQAFAKHVVVPGVPLQDFIIDVQKEVMMTTQNLQQPFSDSSLLEKNIFLADGQ